MTALDELETERLRLTLWIDGSVDELFTMHADPLVARYLDADGRVYDRAKAEERIAGWQKECAEAGLGKFRMIRKADGAFIGRAGFSPFEGGPEIGYSLASAHWGQGYASEIAQGLNDWFFANRPEDAFIGFAHVDNLASRRVLEKIGMTPTHTATVAEMPHQFYLKSRPVSQDSGRTYSSREAVR
ncbi:GNAT family N-acetyltransferase [Devosia nitrariae]|uniref:N-acetyltransferase n=1 Tax=Devosia nitrariae TaxID=2071872 RepID=A0ABQ5W4B5_9HYPH|nr:GNAT family N-acetyltransferase [Devosia nitrariae]GLQ54909.1 N-acetyltransferase [Devosia nitrariae]